MPEISFRAYRDLTSSDERNFFRSEMEAKGYYSFFEFVERFRDALKTYAEPEGAEIGRLLQRARADFPEPGRFSPSWDKLWDELDSIYAAKNIAMAEIPAAERDGEWQVLIDNPYLPEQVVCYPALRFFDAVYLYAYFQQELNPNEFLRLQKVTHRLVMNGERDSSMIP